MSTLVWFKRDLRIHDHPALACAAASGDPVLCLYIVEPEYWAQPDVSRRQYVFLTECLTELADDLARIGAALTIRVGDAVSCLDAVAQEVPVSRLVSHEETGNQWTFARDRAVQDWCRSQGIDWTELPQSGVARRLATRDRWAAQRDAFMREPSVALPERLHTLPLACAAIPTPDALGLDDDGLSAPQAGGRRAAETMLETFLTTRGQTYRRAMSSPLEGALACSRLSPHFAFGSMSIREAVQATATRQRAVRGTRDGWIGSLKSFQSRLAWRDHFMQKLEDAPRLEARCLHSAYEGLRSDNVRLRLAWEQGQTGVPFVDACMRSLIATGWLNFRMRSMLMAFASYHLWLDWRATGMHLARMFTDYEPGIHWSQVQMQSGTTGINTPRIYNPVKQGRDQDPDGLFTRHWVPELRDVPEELLQEPWRWSGVLNYPAPVVDVAQAARHARERIWAVRRQDGFREAAAQVVDKHASRKDRTRRFVRDPAPKQDRQLRFDF